MANRAELPLYERISDYLYNMSALSRREARKQWKDSIKHAWGDCCAYCGKPPIDDHSLTIDHVKPKVKGGEDRTSNVIPACRSCNSRKGSSDWKEWYHQQTFYDPKKEEGINFWLMSNLSNFQSWILEMNQVNS